MIFFYDVFTIKDKFSVVHSFVTCLLTKLVSHLLKLTILLLSYSRISYYKYKKKAHCKKKDICQRSVNICFCTVHTCSCKFASIIRKIYALCRFSYKVSFNSTFAYFIFLVKFMHIMRFEEAGNKFSAKY